MHDEIDADYRNQAELARILDVPSETLSKAITRTQRAGWPLPPYRQDSATGHRRFRTDTFVAWYRRRPGRGRPYRQDTPMDRTRFAPGERYVAERRHWHEANVALIGIRGVQLHLFINRPTLLQERAVAEGTAEFAWIDTPGTAMLCFTFHADQTVAVPWSEALYHAPDELPHWRGTPGATGEPIPATVVLTDASTGLVRATRHAMWPPDAADLIRATITRHAETRQPTSSTASSARSLRRRYPEGPPGTAQLVQQRAAVAWSDHLAD